MVRFHWHVEDGLSAFVPVNGSVLTEHGIQHTMVEIEVPGAAGSAVSMLTTPIGAHKGPTRSVGIVLAHDSDAAEWQSKLLAGMADALAMEGFLVMQNFCGLKEARRQRMFEKALDAAATSPYARHVSSWVLAGLGNGARVAAAVSMRCRGVMAGLVLLSYPLEEPMPASKGAGMPNSSQPIVKARAPLLFVHTQDDPSCSLPALKACCGAMPEGSCRLVVVPGVDPAFKACRSSVDSAVLRKVNKAVVQFVLALETGTLDSCKLPMPSADGLISDDENAADADNDEDEHVYVDSPAPEPKPAKAMTISQHPAKSGHAAAAHPPGRVGTLPGLPDMKVPLSSAPELSTSTQRNNPLPPLPGFGSFGAGGLPPIAHQRPDAPQSGMTGFSPMPHQPAVGGALGMTGLTPMYHQAEVGGYHTGGTLGLEPMEMNGSHAASTSSLGGVGITVERASMPPSFDLNSLPGVGHATPAQAPFSMTGLHPQSSQSAHGAFGMAGLADLQQPDDFFSPMELDYQVQHPANEPGF